MPSSNMPRRNRLTLILLAVSAFLAISFILALRSQADGVSDPTYGQTPIAVTDSILHGEATAHKIENATLKFVRPSPFTMQTS